MFCIRSGRSSIRVLAVILVCHIVFLNLLQPGVCEQTTLIDNLLKKWAPLVWLAPEERYFPLAIEEFLQHVNPADINGRIISSALPIGRSSESLYMITKRDIKSLMSNVSFLNGRNPSKATVPVYVTVSECPKAIKTGCVTRSKRINTSPISCNNDRHINEKHYKSVSNKTRLHATYWMFYPYNEGKGICFFGKIPTPLIFNTCIGRTRTFGNHVGDFEHASISFGHDFVPLEMFLSVHNTGAYYRYDTFSKIFRYDRKLMTKGLIDRVTFPPVIRTFEGHRPILFAAKGSHGLWSAAGNFQYVPVPKLYDQNGYGTPWKTWKDLRIHRVGVSEPPVWMKYFGRWGNPKNNCLLFYRLGFCELSDGPPGIFGRHHDFEC